MTPNPASSEIRSDFAHTALPHFTRDQEPSPTASREARWLDEIHARLSEERADDDDARATLEELFSTLTCKRRELSASQWREMIHSCRNHPLRELVHQDPFTYRAYSKPRGYAGDAEMLDYIYGREEQWPAPSASPVGRRVFDYTTVAPASEGVRARRAFVARLIDEVAGATRLPHVLSIAAGHLREAGLSISVRRREVGRFVALDSDAASLREVERCYAPYGVETVASKFTRLISNPSDLGMFDLVYSTGLFDYLAEPIGRRLTESMFQRLRPGGVLALANFMPEIHDAGYMEAYMDWHLVYRSREEMLALAADIPQAEVRSITISAEESQNIIFLSICKR